MDEDFKKVVEATRVIAEVCKKHFKLIDGNILDCGDCPLRYPKHYDEFDCRLHNYPFDYSTEVEYFEDDGRVVT